MKNPESVPKQLEEVFEKIASHSDQFCKKKLNDEYALLIRKLIATLCRKRPSPLINGKARTWAAGITHALGMVNFLFDSSQDPYVSSKELAAFFELAQSTISNKSKQIRDLLKMSYFDHKWTLPSKVGSSPLSWMISVNGFIVDARSLPIEVQQRAYEKGLIPYVSDLENNNDLMIGGENQWMTQ